MNASMDSNSTKSQILEYLKKVCGGSPIGSDSLAMIGIDSVAMAELTFELEKRFDIQIGDDVLDVDTVDELVNYVVARQSAMTN
jgi:acyl carrier protein